jgi:hypothetical protein
LYPPPPPLPLKSEIFLQPHSEPPPPSYRERLILSFASIVSILTILAAAICLTVATQSTRYALTLSGCDATRYDTIQPASQWPSASADFYSSHGGLTNITASSWWYANENAAIGWHFEPVAGICPMAVVQVEIVQNKAVIWSGSYEQFVTEDPYGLAPSVSSRRRLVSATESSDAMIVTKVFSDALAHIESPLHARRLSFDDDNSASNGQTVNYYYEHCLRRQVAATAGVFSNIDAENAANDIDSQFADGYSTWLSGIWTVKYGVIALWSLLPANLCCFWLWSRPTNQVLKVKKLYIFLANIGAGVALATSYQALDLLLHNEWLTQPSDAWAPLFPSCRVQMYIWGNGRPLLEASLTCSVMAALLQLLLWRGVLVEQRRLRRGGF